MATTAYNPKGFPLGTLTRSGLEQRLSDTGSAPALLDEIVDYAIESENPERLQFSDCILVADCISFLASHGARVATEEPGCPFEKLILGVTGSKSSLLLQVARKLSEHPGELPFHLLARRFPLQTSDTMMSKPDLQSGLRALDSTGRTVSHYLWDEQSEPVRRHDIVRKSGAQATNVHKKNWIDSVYAAWAMQDNLHKAGFSMFVPDHEGRTAMDLCIDRLQAKDTRSVHACEVYKQVKACMDQRDLLANTDQVEPSPTRTGPRL